jgi:hypothetical protein
MGERERRSLRPWLAGFGVGIAVFSGLRLVAGQPPAEHRGRTVLAIASPAPARAESLLSEGAEAAAKGELMLADSALRRAWRDPVTRDRAAESLRTLHRSPGFKLAADEAQVGGVARILGTEFRRSETAHFVVLSDCPPAWTQERARILERTRDQFYRVTGKMGIPAMPHRHKLLCVLFAQRDAYRSFARAQDGMEAAWVAGYYTTAGNRIVFYNDSSSPAFSEAQAQLTDMQARARAMRDRAIAAERDGHAAEAAALRDRADELAARVRQERAKLDALAGSHSTAKATHEASHLLAFNSGLQAADRDYPFWISEGLATCFEADDVRSAFGPDRPAPKCIRVERFAELRDAERLIPIHTLIMMAEAPAGDAELADAMYAQSHVLFATLFGKDPKALGRYLLALADESNAGRDRGLGLFTSHFGDPAAIEKRMLRFSTPRN